MKAKQKTNRRVSTVLMSTFGSSAISQWPKSNGHAVRMYVEQQYTNTRVTGTKRSAIDVSEDLGKATIYDITLSTGEGTMSLKYVPRPSRPWHHRSCRSHTSRVRVTRADTWRAWEKRLVMILRRRRWMYSIFKLPFGRRRSNAIRATQRRCRDAGDYVQCN